MPINFSPKAWPQRFFAGPNTLTWEDLQTGADSDDWVADILPWLELLDRDNADFPAILPRRSPEGQVRWYGVARTHRAALGLAEDLAGFIGPSYVGFSRLPQSLDVSDECEAALAEAFPEPVFRISPVSADDAAQIRRLIRIYCVVLARRPTPSRLAARSLGLLRSRFDRALLAGNELEAQDLFEEILTVGRLSWENRLYLKIRLYAGLGLWPQIAGDAGLLREAAHLAMPAQVRADLVEAVYRTHAERWEESSDAEAALDSFRTADLRRFQGIFATRQGIERPRVVKAFLLYALLRPDADRQDLDTLCARLPTATPSDVAFSTALMEMVARRGVSPSGESDSEAADQAYDEMEFDRAFSLYSSLPCSRKTMSRLLSCASRIRTPEAARIALAAVESQPDGTEPLSATVRSVIEDLRSLIESRVGPASTNESVDALPGDWLSWARWVRSGVSAADACRVLDQRSETWSTEELRRGGQGIVDFADDLGACMGEAIRAALPRIFETFVLSQEEPIPNWKPLYVMLLTVLALADSVSLDDLELATTLVAAILDVGVDRREYEAVVADLEALLNDQASLGTLDWALDAAEVLAVGRAPASEARLRFIVKVLDVARARVHRLQVGQLETLRLLCRDVNIELPVGIEETVLEQKNGTLGTDLNDRTVAIYTLTDSAGRRAMETLRKLFPTVKVSLNGDLVCSERLLALAQHAEFFVFAWRSSSHAAYYCVKDNRPKDMPLLLPRGKGTASILQELIGG